LSGLALPSIVISNDINKIILITRFMVSVILLASCFYGFCHKTTAVWFLYNTSVVSVRVKE
jgi:hypothetical protein